MKIDMPPLSYWLEPSSLGCMAYGAVGGGFHSFPLAVAFTVIASILWTVASQVMDRMKGLT